MSAPVALLGGSFDPVHCGHLRCALELREQLGLAEVRLLPSARPPHRPAPELSPEQRSELVHLAIAGEPGLVCDDRELRRPGPSYTIDSLVELRGELGPGRSLLLAMGTDVLRGLAQWRRWRELLDFAHLVVVERAGHGAAAPDPVAHWLSRHETSDRAALRQSAQGLVLRVRLRPLAISATEIRAALASGRSVRYLLPEPVWSQIRQRRWYACEPASAAAASPGGN